MVNPFETPENECSFSGLVDAAIVEVGGSTSIRKIAQYANQTIRECQQVGLFEKDSDEDTIVATASPHIWAEPAFFRAMRGVEYPEQRDYKGNPIHPDFIQPGKAQVGKTTLYYAVNGSFVFGGVDVGETISLAYYLWSKRFLYYARPSQLTRLASANLFSENRIRQAYYDTEAQCWYYLNADNSTYALTLNDPTTEELYRTNSLHWLIRDHWDLVFNGIVSKVMTKRGDTTKAAPYFSQYQQAKTALAQTVGLESLGR